MGVPVGLVHLISNLPIILSPALLTYVILQHGVFRFYPALIFPHFATFLVSLVVTPIYFVLSCLWSDYANKRAAAARGAIVAPYVESDFLGLSNIRKMVQNFKDGYPGDIFLDWMRQYGNSFTLKLVSEDRMFTVEPDHIKAVLATQFDDFEKGPVLYSQFSTMLGTGVFNSDGDRWKFHRSMTRPFFSKERIAHFDIFDRHANDALNQAKVRLDAGYPIDFQDMVSRFTLDSATEFLFGKDVRSLSAGLPYPSSSPLSASIDSNHPANIFADAFMDGQNLSSLRSRYGPRWPLFEWHDRIRPYRDIVNGFIDPIIEDALSNAKNTGSLSGSSLKAEAVAEEETLLSHLVKITQDHKTIQDEILNIMIAGRDTTASTLTYAIYMLSEHPSILAKLRAEILEKVGPSRRPTYDDMRDMKYLRAFVNEVLRLYPAVPFNSRTSKRDTVLHAKGFGSPSYFVPAGTKVVYSVFLMHRRTDLWGPDALVFDPDRFLDERLHKYLTPNPFIFVPFNAGPRICLGQQFAYHETSFFLVRLLQRFSGFSLALDVQPASSRPPAEWASREGTQGTEKIMPGTHLTMYVRGGLWVRMDEDKSGEI